MNYRAETSRSFGTGLTAIARALACTLRRLLRIAGRRTVTIRYPEEKRRIPKGFRGEHRLKKDNEGREKCVACFLCQAACPAGCIRIVAEESPWPDRDKRAAIFEIDMLRCIYCGMCEESCLFDAIELTQKVYTVATSRKEMIYDKEKLLKN